MFFVYIMRRESPPIFVPYPVAFGLYAELVLR